MSLETGTYISDLVATNPLASDPRSEGDDHIRLLKAVIKATFPNIDGVVNPTPAELNYLVGVTSAIQTQLTAALAVIPSGTVMPFFQASAPTGWTQITTHNNKALRVVSGTGGGNGGSVAFTTAFASQTPAGTIGGTALTVAQLPAHTHTGGVTTFSYTGDIASGGTWGGQNTGQATGSTGSGATHTHTFTGTAINLAVQYIDMIIASKN